MWIEYDDEQEPKTVEALDTTPVTQRTQQTTRTVSDVSLPVKPIFTVSKAARLDDPISRSANSIQNMPQPQTAEICEKRVLRDDDLWRYPDDILGHLYSKQNEWREQMKQLWLRRINHDRLTMVDGVHWREQSKKKDRERAFLIDWLVKIHDHDELKPETLHLAVAILDKGLLQLDIYDKMQMYTIGLTALFIASKYEEVVSLSMEDLLRLAKPYNLKFKFEDIFEYEVNLLLLNDFDLRLATSQQFFEIFANKVEAK